MTQNNTLDVLRHADPATGLPDAPLDRRAADDLTRILGEAPAAEPPARRRIGRRTLLVSVAAVSAGAIGLVVADPFGATAPAVATTPPMLDNVLRRGKPAGPALSRLAAVTRANTTLPGDGTGPHVVRTESWALSTRVDGKSVHSEVVPEIGELTWNSDRSGHLSKRIGKPYSSSSDHRPAWNEDGSPGKQGKVIDELTWQPGGYTPSFPDQPLPSEPGRLLTALKAGHPIDEIGTAELVVAIADLYRESLPAPDVRAALLRLLAVRPDVISLGRLADRAGRPTECFAVDSAYSGLPQRELLMFDPTTGALLAAEDILTKSAGALRVRVPSTISYDLIYPTK